MSEKPRKPREGATIMGEYEPMRATINHVWDDESWDLSNDSHARMYLDQIANDYAESLRRWLELCRLTTLGREIDMEAVHETIQHYRPLLEYRPWESADPSGDAPEPRRLNTRWLTRDVAAVRGKMDRGKGGEDE